MRFGLCTSIDNIEKVEQLGFDYLEASASTLAGLPEADFKETIKKACSAGIQVECFNVLFPKTISLLGTSVDWMPVHDYLHRAFERIKRLQGEIVVFGSGKCRSFPPETGFDEGHRQLVQVIAKTGELAAEYGITIVIEPLNSSESNMINSVAEGAIIRAEVNMENVELLADSYHMFRENEPIENIKRVGGLLHTHVAALEGRKFPVALDEKLAAFFQALKEIHYQGRMSIEGKADEFETDAAQALKVLKELDDMK